MAISAGYCSDQYNSAAEGEEAVTAAERKAYNQALSDCIGLLRKWFWGTDKNARACEIDIRKLAK